MFTEDKNLKTFAAYDSDTPVTLKHGQGHQTWYGMVDPKQGYNPVKFKKPHWNSVHEKANKGFLQIRKHVNYLP